MLDAITSLTFKGRNSDLPRQMEQLNLSCHSDAWGVEKKECTLKDALISHSSSSCKDGNKIWNAAAGLFPQQENLVGSIAIHSKN